MTQHWSTLIQKLKCIHPEVFLSLLDGHMTETAPREWMRQERGQSGPYTPLTATDSGTPVNNRKLVGVSVSYSASRIV